MDRNAWLTSELIWNLLNRFCLRESIRFNERFRDKVVGCAWSGAISCTGMSRTPLSKNGQAPVAALA